MTYSLSPIALLHESHFDTRHKNGNRGKNAKTLLEYIDTSKHTAHKRNLVRISRQLCDSALITQVLMLQVVFMPANMMSCMQQMEMKSDFALKLIKENRTSATGVYTAVSMVRENVFHCTNIKILTYIRTCSQTVHT